jgi:hypothetical protein
MLRFICAKKSRSSYLFCSVLLEPKGKPKVRTQWCQLQRGETRSEGLVQSPTVLPQRGKGTQGLLLSIHLDVRLSGMFPTHRSSVYTDQGNGFSDAHQSRFHTLRNGSWEHSSYQATSVRDIIIPSLHFQANQLSSVVVNSSISLMKTSATELLKNLQPNCLSKLTCLRKLLFSKWASKALHAA